MRRLVELRPASAVVALCLIAASVSTSSAVAADRPASDGSGIAWTSCDPPKSDGHHLECAKVPVPLNWNRPNGKKIELAVIRYLASRPEERIGSMFVNPGGPGLSGVELARDAGADFDVLGRGRFDVVSWDPRGTNGSSPVECFTSTAARDRFWQGVTIPTTAAESQAYQRKAVELARRCGEVSGELLAHLSTADTARDLEALRKAVGDRLLTYVGLSYGTWIGQTYANLFPGRVRAMMLDGNVDVVDSTNSAEARTVNNVSFADEVFEQFQAACQSAGPAHCALAGHGETVAQRVARLFAAARRAPIPAPNAHPPGQLSYSHLLVSTFNPLRLPADWPQFAADLDAAANGDATNLETNVRQLLTPEGFAGATTSAAISCVDGPANRPSTAWPEVIDDFTDAGNLWGALAGWWLWAPCASNWPAHSTDRYTGPWNATTKTPILLINARYDPASGYRNAQVAERRLGNAVLLTLNGYGHPSYQVPSACIDEWRVRYLVDLVTPPRGTVCQPDHTPFP
jgi:pimeloyl-ACP methyl ester carboxylesterase